MKTLRPREIRKLGSVYDRVTELGIHSEFSGSSDLFQSLSSRFTKGIVLILLHICLSSFSCQVCCVCLSHYLICSSLVHVCLAYNENSVNIEREGGRNGWMDDRRWMMDGWMCMVMSK